MIIGACGFCATGSSAICDYLREFDDCQVLDGFEFTIPYLPDGLEDLEYHLMRHTCRDDSSSIAIPRFRRFMELRRGILEGNSIPYSRQKEIVDDFLNHLIQFQWNSIRRSDELLYPSLLYKVVRRTIRKKIIPFLNKRMGRCVHIYPYRKIDVSIIPDNFEGYSKNFIKSILKEMGADFTKKIVLDQPFIGENPERCFHFFDNPKAIVVDRDPRDNYLFMKTYMYKKTNMMPADTVENFVKYYKILRNEKAYLKHSDDILNIKFESLVYDYENSTQVIRNFCDLPDNRRPHTYFNPSKSVNNTQLFIKYPQYTDDIKYIEDSLTDYLFDFDKYPKPDNSGEMFDKAKE